MLEASDREKYLLDRIRGLSRSTNTWGFAFLFSLLFTFFSTIVPKYNSLKVALTEKQNSEYLKIRLSAKARNFDTFRARVYDTIRQDSRLLGNAFTTDTAIRKELSNLKKNKSIDTFFAQLNNPSEPKYFDTLKKTYDSLNKKIQRLQQTSSAKAQAAQDSLFKASNISFKLPGLEAVNLDTRDGLLVWILLTLVFMYYVFDVRNKIADNVKKLYLLYSFEQNARPKDYRHLDLQLQFWFTPVIFPDNNSQKKFKDLIGWKKPLLMYVCNILCLILWYCLILVVAWLSWNINNNNFFREYIFIYDFIVVIEISMITFLILLWLKPINFIGNAY
jgi:hypothetical protein